MMGWPVLDIAVPEPALPDCSVRFKAFSYFSPKDTRVIILGQDPYPAPGKANGLAFGIHRDWQGHVFQSSFGNLFEEVVRYQPLDYQPLSLTDWCTLEGWAEQGVLLTNTRLTVAPGTPMSHAGIGWETVVRACVLNAIRKANPVLVAFGSEARRFYEKQLKFLGIDADKHKQEGRLLCYSHPCRYSATRGSKNAPAFVGSDCFSQINKALLSQGRKPINWWRVSDV